MIENNLKLKKNILSNLLSSKFEDKLHFLESSTNNYFSIRNTSKNIVNSVTNTCISLEKIMKEQFDLKNKKNQVSSLNLGLNTSKRNTTIGLISRTPFRQNKNLKSNKNQLINIEMKKSKSNINLLKNRQSHRSNTIKNIKKDNNNLKLTMTIKLNNDNNIHQLKRSKTERDMRSNKKNHNLNKGNKKLQISTKNLLKFDKNKSIDSTISNNKLKDIQSKTFDDNEEKISGLENDLILNESLLIENNDIDFIPKGLLINTNDIEITYHISYFKVLDYAEEQLPFILKYLSIQDYLNLMYTCKIFKKIINENILSNLKKEKIKYEKKINIFNLEQILIPYDPKNIILTKGALKAVCLLNQTSLNKLFTQISVPSDDILLIYHIYFQLINHSITKEFNNKEIFWKKCRKYFTEESNGKNGELLLKNVKDDIDLSSENIYKIIHILNEQFNKITPAYFSKICSTTGLFAFFIKDIFDFLGISDDKKIKPNSYWTYKGIIEVINKKIEKMKMYVYQK